MKYNVLVEGWTLVEVDALTPEDAEDAAREAADIPRHSWTTIIVPDAKEEK